MPGLPYRYALPRVALDDEGPTHTIMARAQFVDLFARYFPDRLVYEIDDTLERARERLIARGSDAHEIDVRLAGHQEEIEAGRKISSRSFANAGSLDDLVAAITAALRVDVSASFGQLAVRPS